MAKNKDEALESGYVKGKEVYTVLFSVDGIWKLEVDGKIVKRGDPDKVIAERDKIWKARTKNG